VQHATKEFRMTQSPATLPTLRISAGDLLAWKNAGQRATILDARSPADWERSTRRIQGAIRAQPEPLRVDASWPKEQLIAVYCTCPQEALSARVVQALREQGFHKAFALRGGLDAWEAIGGPVEPK
jgi:rhodanese-related sulfurtransferase